MAVACGTTMWRYRGSSVYLVYLVRTQYHVAVPWQYHVAVPRQYCVIVPWQYHVAVPWQYHVAIPWQYHVAVPWQLVTIIHVTLTFVLQKIVVDTFPNFIQLLTKSRIVQALFDMGVKHTVQDEHVQLGYKPNKSVIALKSFGVNHA